MCGLIGFTGKEGVYANPDIIRKLMKANDKRGGHSTGFWNGNHFQKVIGKSKNLQLNNTLKAPMFIGHTRYATHGTINKKNQHPFKYGEVVGAHNGVVHNYREVGEKFGLKKTEVDSQMIFKVMNKTQHKFETLGKFSGALATLFSLGDDKFYTYRKTNPLWVGRDKNGGVYFSSLRDVMVKECKLTNVFQLKEGRLYIWKDGNVISKIDIEHDPIESKYGSVKKQWWEYRQPKITRLWTPQKSLHSGITDQYDDIDDIDITDYDLTDNQDQLDLFLPAGGEDATRCECQDNSADLCWCYTK